MSASEHQPWTDARDDQLVERLIWAVQRAVAREISGQEQPTEDVAVPSAELATAFLNLLASVLVGAPVCTTSRGMRLVSAAAGKELHVLMRGARQLTFAPASDARH